MTVRNCWFLFVVMFAVSQAGVARTAPTTDGPQCVVVISVDGLAAFYLNDPQAEIPTMRTLAKAGASATTMKASAPSVTWPNHTTMATGVTPARHGVVGNDYFDRVQKKTEVLITDPEGAKDPLVRAPTIYDVAKQAGLSTAAVRWPATGAAKTLDWTIPDVFSAELLHKYSTPALVEECTKAGIWSDGEIVRNKGREAQIVSDETCTRITNHILREHRPNLSLIHLTNVDKQEHLHGPRSPAAYAALKAADAQVREIWEEVKRDYPGSATLLVVSDHGFTPVEHVLLPNVTLRKADLVQVVDGKAKPGAVHVVSQGGAALVYIVDQDRRAKIVDQLQGIFDGHEGVAKIVVAGHLSEHGLAEPADEPRSPDVLVFAKEGYMFSDAVDGDTTVVAPREYKGMHGHDENLAAMQASFIAWGVGIKPGAELGKIENTAVAPTIARLLGLALPNVDGKPLTAALSD